MEQKSNLWFFMAPIGLILIGMGFSVATDAAQHKARGGFWRWFVQGTLGLICLNAGIAVFGDAVKRKAVQEIREG
jgi:hypothetical protein